MKNVQIIDGATNCSHSIYSVPDDVFSEIFPEENQDIEFWEDVIRRVGKKRATELMKFTWHSRIVKRELLGLHGTLFIDLERRKQDYPNKRDSDLD